LVGIAPLLRCCCCPYPATAGGDFSDDHGRCLPYPVRVRTIMASAIATPFGGTAVGTLPGNHGDDFLQARWAYKCDPTVSTLAGISKGGRRRAGGSRIINGPPHLLPATFRQPDPTGKAIGRDSPICVRVCIGCLRRADTFGPKPSLDRMAQRISQIAGQSGKGNCGWWGAYSPAVCVVESGAYGATGAPMGSASPRGEGRSPVRKSHLAARETANGDSTSDIVRQQTR